MSGLAAFPALAEERAAPVEVFAACGVAAVGVARASWDEVAALRLAPGPVPGGPLPAGFLKHSDEQTVVGLAAVLRAIHGFGLEAGDFTIWGVLAAARFLGRVAVAEVMHKFATGGSTKASPLAIPHRSLHSVSGAVALALRVHGPNFGVGGGAGHVGEGLLTAMSVLDGGALPGLWLLLTGWDPEPVPDRDGRCLMPTCCTAVALALVPDAEETALRLRLTPSVTTPNAPEIRLPDLADFLAPVAERRDFGPRSFSLGWGGTLEFAPRP